MTGTERYCEVCRETKDWKKYYLEGNMCRDCWHKAIKAREHDYTPNVGGERRKRRKSREDLMAEFLEGIERLGSR